VSKLYVFTPIAVDAAQHISDSGLLRPEKSPRGKRGRASTSGLVGEVNRLGAALRGKEEETREARALFRANYRGANVTEANLFRRRRMIGVVIDANSNYSVFSRSAVAGKVLRLRRRLFLLGSLVKIRALLFHVVGHLPLLTVAEGWRLALRLSLRLP